MFFAYTVGHSAYFEIHVMLYIFIFYYLKIKKLRVCVGEWYVHMSAVAYIDQREHRIFWSWSYSRYRVLAVEAGSSAGAPS